jgi:hypothetical protein
MTLSFRNLISKHFAGPFVILFLFLNHMVVFSQPIRILPLGNSLTYGTNIVPDPNTPTHASYRKKLHDLMEQAGYNIDLIGSRSSGYQLFSDAQHCGLPGICNEDLASILHTGYNPNSAYQYFETSGPYLNFFPPDIILLEVGTNDVINNDIWNLNAMSDIFNDIDAYESLSGKPVLVFVAKIISTENTSGSCNVDSKVNTYNFNLASIVNSRISAGDHLVLVDMQCGAGINYAADMLDIYHPNQSGYDKMGQTWFDAINNFNTAPVLTAIPNQTISEGSLFNTISLDNYISDNEDSDIDISWSFSPASPVNYNVSIAGRIATITPKNPDWNGQEDITFTATDRGKVLDVLKKSTSCTTTFKVTPVNDPPSITMPSERSIDVNQLYAVTFATHDKDIGDIVTLSVQSKPVWLSYNAGTYTLYGIPAPSDAGDHTVVMRATDGKSVIDSVMTVTVVPLQVSVDPEFKTAPYLIYPNPASDYFTIYCENELITDIKLIDLSGKIVYASKISPAMHEVTVVTSGMSSGIIFCSVTTRDKVFTSKINLR